MEQIKDKLSGVFAPIATPFKNDEILFDGLRENIEKMNKTGLKGYFALGTNGEFKSLSIEERLKVLEVVVKYRAPDKIIMAGTAEESTKVTIEITLEAAKIGADMVSLLLPHFFIKRLDDDALADYVIAVAEVSPVPVLLYNNPSVSANLTLSYELIKRVSAHPNIVGLKDSSKGNFKEYIKAAQDQFYVLAGSANFFFDLLLAGGVGGVLSLANVFPDTCSKLFMLYKEGKIEEAKKLNEKLINLNKEVSGSYGVAGVKAAMDIVGFIGGDPRRPLKPLTDSQKENLKKKLVEKGFI